MKNPLYGLVLSGGKSERMGQDKALLSYNGKQTQLERTAELVHEACEKVFVSLRKEQNFVIPKYARTIFDSIEEVKGPLCGILSAMNKEPDADWLVVACDQPYLSFGTLKKLIDYYGEKEPQLTAYRSTSNGQPEPLCAIYPAGQGGELLACAKELNSFSPRTLLLNKHARLVDQDDPKSLDNINTAEEYKALTNAK